jgi:hypothetical protein
MGIGYGAWYDGCCASSGIVDLTTSLAGFTTGAWHTIRVEYDLTANETVFYKDGIEMYRTTSIPLVSMSPTYIQLRAGTTCCSTAANVLWSNLEVYEGSR